MREPVRLDGHSLTAAQIAAVARENAPVELSPQAMETVRLSRETVLRLAGQQDRKSTRLNSSHMA